MDREKIVILRERRVRVIGELIEGAMPSGTANSPVVAIEQLLASDQDGDFYYCRTQAASPSSAIMTSSRLEAAEFFEREVFHASSAEEFGVAFRCFLSVADATNSAPAVFVDGAFIVSPEGDWRWSPSVGWLTIDGVG